MSLDLISLNNSIVSLRGPIRQAKVHIMHHLTRQMGKLKSMKASEEQKRKNERKIERFLAEIKILKEADRDELGKFSVRNKKKLEQVLDNTDDLRSRVLVRVATHGAVQKSVDAFRKKYPDWETCIQSLMARLGRIQDKKSPGVKMKKLEKNKKRGKEMSKKRIETKTDQKSDKDKATKVAKSSDGSEEEQDNAAEQRANRKKKRNVEAKNSADTVRSDDDISDDDNSETDGSDASEKQFVNSLRNIIKTMPRSAGGKTQEETADENEEEDQNNESNDENDLDSDAGDFDASEDNETDEDSGVKNEGQHKKRKMIELKKDKKPKNEKIYRREGVMEVKTLNLKAMEETSSSDDVKSDADIPEVSKSGPKRVPKGSFFLGGESDSENDDDAKEPDESKRKQKSPFNKDQRSFIIDKSGQRGKDQPFSSVREHASTENQRERGFPRGKRSGTSRGRGRGSEIKGEFNYRKEREANERRGFEPRGRGFRNDRKRGFAPGSVNRKEANEGDKSHGGEKIHPSWAAKRQAQNSGIAKFQGKKMRFDETGLDSKTSNQSTLHPSWAAKKDKQEQIKPFQGKKTVFSI